MQECDGYENGYLLWKSLEHKTAFFSNATKYKHGKDCGTSFDVALLIEINYAYKCENVFCVELYPWSAVQRRINTEAPIVVQ